MDTYKTIKTLSEGIYKEKGSKFLSFAIPVSEVFEIKESIKLYRKHYFDARHICYAYIIGNEEPEYRTNDDGEPSGTAGKPILGQLNSRNLTNILVIVVRYFGGILLGTSGLATAYKEACSDALNNSEIIEKSINSTITIQFNYLQMNEIMRIIKDNNLNILSQSFDNICSMQLVISKRDIVQIISKLKKITELKILED